MQLLSVATQLSISTLVLVFRWPRDPGALHARPLDPHPVLPGHALDPRLLLIQAPS